MRLSRRSVLGGSMAIGAAAFGGSRRRARAQGVTYSIRDLGAYPDTIERGMLPYRTYFAAINDNGEVGGGLVVSDVKVSPAIWPVEGNRVRLKSGKYGGEVLALNESGTAVGREFRDVIGVKEGQNFGIEYLPAAWQDGEPFELAIPEGMGADPANLLGQANDVNADGLIAGLYEDFSTAQSQPVVWRDGAIETLLALPEGSATATALFINAAGVVAGTAARVLEFGEGVSGSYDAPVLWTDGQPELLDLPEDVVLPTEADQSAPNIFVLGLSDAGQLLVTFSVLGDDGAYRYSAYISERGTWTPLSSPSDSHPEVTGLAMSSTGAVIGRATETVDNPETLHVVWTDGEPRNLAEALPDLEGFTIRGLMDINSAGELLAVAGDDADVFHGLVLTPE